MAQPVEEDYQMVEAVVSEPEKGNLESNGCAASEGGADTDAGGDDSVEPTPRSEADSAAPSTPGRGEDKQDGASSGRAEHTPESAAAENGHGETTKQTEVPEPAAESTEPADRVANTEQALASLTEENLREMAARHESTKSRLMEHEQELLAEKEALTEDNVKLKETIEVVMESTRKIPITAANTVDPSLEGETPMDYVKRNLQRMAERSGITTVPTVPISEHVGELKKPPVPSEWSYADNAKDRVSEMWQNAASGLPSEGTSELTRDLRERAAGLLDPAWAPDLTAVRDRAGNLLTPPDTGALRDRAAELLAPPDTGALRERAAELLGAGPDLGGVRARASGLWESATMWGAAAPAEAAAEDGAEADAGHSAGFKEAAAGLWGSWSGGWLSRTAPQDDEGNADPEDLAERPVPAAAEDPRTLLDKTRDVMQYFVTPEAPLEAAEVEGPVPEPAAMWSAQSLSFTGTAFLPEDGYAKVEQVKEKTWDVYSNVVESAKTSTETAAAAARETTAKTASLGRQSSRKAFEAAGSVEKTIHTAFEAMGLLRPRHSKKAGTEEPHLEYVVDLTADADMDPSAQQGMDGTQEEDADVLLIDATIRLKSGPQALRIGDQDDASACVTTFAAAHDLTAGQTSALLAFVNHAEDEAERFPVELDKSIEDVVTQFGR